MEKENQVFESPQWQVDDLPFPFPDLAGSCEKVDILNCRFQRHGAIHFDYPRHRFSREDSFVRKARDCVSVVCEENPVFARRLFQDDRIGRVFQSHVLNADDIQ